MCLACELDTLWYGGFDLPAGPLRPAVEPGTAESRPSEPEPSAPGPPAAGDPAALPKDGAATAARRSRRRSRRATGFSCEET